MTESDSPGFVSATRRGHVSPAQVLVAALALAAIACGATGLVRLAATEDRVGSVVMLVGGSGLALLGACGFLRLRGSEHYELSVSSRGLGRKSRTRSDFWHWSDITSLTVSGGVVRHLVIEDERADQVRAKAPRLDSIQRGLGNGSPVAVRMPLNGMEPDEFSILKAIETASAGRFPG